MNGVCTQWKGWINLEKLEGAGALEYDEERGAIEEKILKEQMERYVSRMKEFEERQRFFKEAQERQAKIESEVSVIHRHCILTCRRNIRVRSVK